MIFFFFFLYATVTIKQERILMVYTTKAKAKMPFSYATMKSSDELIIGGRCGKTLEET